jgi:hypothetical protein
MHSYGEVFTDPGPGTCSLGSGAAEDGDQNHVTAAALRRRPSATFAGPARSTAAALKDGTGCRR